MARIVGTFLAAVSFIIFGDRGFGAETKPTRPYFCLFAASIDRLIDSCEQIFESVDRRDLSASLEDRLKPFQNFDGIDRTRPLGIFSIWDDHQSKDVVFLPIEDPDDIEALLKTATFGVVSYHKVSPTHYRIDRPGSPYEVVIRDRYVLLADSLAMIQGLTITPDQLTRGHRDRYELTLMLDPTQIPSSTRTKYVKELRDQAEPALQPQDNEQPETARIRRALGNLALSVIERTILDTSVAVFGIHLEPDSKKLSAEFSLHALKNSPMAATFEQWNRHRSHFMSLIASDVPAGVAINVPVGGFFDEVLGNAEHSPAKKPGRLDAGIQIVGNQMGKMTLIGALRGDETLAFNKAIPDLMEQLHKARQIEDVVEDFDSIDGISLHSFMPCNPPEWLTAIVGPAPEVIVGQGTKTTWIGIGQTSVLLDDLEEAIDRVGDGSTEKNDVPLVSARIQATQLPELVKSDLLIPNTDRETAKQVLAKGDDGISLTVDRISGGIRSKIEAEQGFVRLIGKDWVKQIESRSKE